MKITDKAVQNFINDNLHQDCHSLLLKQSPFEGVEMQSIVEQINGRKIARKKLPFLLQPNIIFPPKINLEQTSSQVVAEYKSQFFSGKSFIDLTCGFGIDAYFLSQKFDETILVEQDKSLLKIVEHNWRFLGRKAKFIHQKLEIFLNENHEKFDLIYLDPARRDNDKRKVFLLEDLSPNILEIQEKLLKISNKILIKLSPLIDIKYLLSTLKNISTITVIAVKNDVKEVLILLDTNHKDNVEIKAINLETSEPNFSFKITENNIDNVKYGEIEKYLYIPNNAVLKTGAFNILSSKMNLVKLHPNTHFYTSQELIKDFPGRILEIEQINAKSIKKGENYNIIAKNYPLKPEEIKKKYKIKDGGTQYLIFTQTQKGKIILKSY